MNSQNKFDKKIRILLEQVELPCSANGEFDTCKILYGLASKNNWISQDLEKLTFLSERIDISKKIFLGYHLNGQKAVENELSDNNWLELTIAILLKGTLTRSVSSLEQNLKRFNVLYKALDLFQPTWLSSDSDLGKIMASEWNSLLQALPSQPKDLLEKTLQITTFNKCRKLKIIPLTVLFYEGPIARAYLESMKQLGFKPNNIIELVMTNDMVTNKPLGKWLPTVLRSSYAASIHRSKIHYWPKHLLKCNTDFVTSVTNEVSKKLGFPETTLKNATNLLPLTTYSKNIISIMAENLGDKKLQEYLSNEIHEPILFTGGGLLPASLLNIKKLKFLHVHPGFLPNIRGADCALWSSLLTGHTSASCFYMSLGIDTGDIIQSYWLPKLKFGLNTRNLDTQSMYRIVYSFLDPWIRAYVLREILKNNTSFDRLNSVSQDTKTGETFHFMHEKLKDISLNRLIQ